MKFFRSRRGVAAIAALLLLLFLFRPGVDQLRNRIAGSIGSALGRRVSLDSVHLRLLPRPGFDLEGLVIYDDPAFSAEPMIRAQEVSAAIRFRSLLRGRLEIATLTATEPSVNLVRNAAGRWNLSALIERNAQIPAAPTAKPSYERRPAFPYLEASNARVNLKIEQTKKSYALVDADVALWQDSDNSWSARIKAEPVRTDFNLTDTGLLRINATWQRAADLRMTPLRIATQWQNGQLGQITQLLSGKDRGWRGGVNLSATLIGTPEALRIESQSVIENFHRFDILASENLRLATTCSAQYNAVTTAFQDLLCESPVGGGHFRVRGELAAFSGAPTYDLTLSVEQVPLSSLVRLLRQSKKQIPGDLMASGLLNAEFRATNNADGSGTAAATHWTGGGAATNVLVSSLDSSKVHLEGDREKYGIAVATIPVNLVSAESRETGSVRRHKSDPAREQEPDDAHLRIGPIALAMGPSAPVSVGGWLSTAGYRFFLHGEMKVRQLFRIEDTLDLPVSHPLVEGSAKLDLSLSGMWRGFAPPVAAGTGQLHNVRAEVNGFSTPIEISAANVTLTADTMELQKLLARTGNSHWTGEVTAPRHCPPSTAPSETAPNRPSACLFRFDLTVDQLSGENLAEWFTPSPAKRPWYRGSTSNDPVLASPLLAIQARGKLHVARLGIKKLDATEISAQMQLDRGKITLSNLRGKLLQGTHQGNWTVDTSVLPFRYHGAGTLKDISLTQLATSMDDSWIAGTAAGNFEFEGSGEDLHDVLFDSRGKLQFVMGAGGLPHIQIPGTAAPLSVRRFVGKLNLSKGTWDLSDGRLEMRDGIYSLGGKLSSTGQIECVLTRGDNTSWALTGTLDKTRVTPIESVKH